MGQPNKAPYALGYGGGMTANFNSLHDASKDANIKFKVNSKRLG